jgi:hypothetical protein
MPDKVTRCAAQHNAGRRLERRREALDRAVPRASVPIRADARRAVDAGLSVARKPFRPLRVRDEFALRNFVSLFTEQDEIVSLGVPVHAVAVISWRLAERCERSVGRIHQQEPTRLGVYSHASLPRRSRKGVGIGHLRREGSGLFSVGRGQRQRVQLAGEQQDEPLPAERHHVAVVVRFRQRVVREHPPVERVGVEPAAPRTLIQHAARRVVRRAQAARAARHGAKQHRALQLA